MINRLKKITLGSVCIYSYEKNITNVAIELITHIAIIVTESKVKLKSILKKSAVINLVNVYVIIFGLYT